jgi:FtsZ-interacting cell division protein YlmF
MTHNQKLKEAVEHIRKLHQEMLVTHPKLSLLGVTPEEKEITEQVHAILWMGALKQKPKAYKEADEFIKTIIIGNAVMIDLGFIDKHAELI